MTNEYTYWVEFSSDLDGYVTRTAEFPALSWVGTTPVKAIQGIVALVDDALADMARTGEEPPPVADAFPGWTVARDRAEASSVSDDREARVREIGEEIADRSAELNRRLSASDSAPELDQSAIDRYAEQLHEANRHTLDGGYVQLAEELKASSELSMPEGWTVAAADDGVRLRVDHPTVTEYRLSRAEARFLGVALRIEAMRLWERSSRGDEK